MLVVVFDGVWKWVRAKEEFMLLVTVTNRLSSRRNELPSVKHWSRAGSADHNTIPYPLLFSPSQCL